MEQLACGELGLGYYDFYDLTPRSFQNIAEGYFASQQRAEQMQWEHTRFIAFWSTKQTKPSVTSPSQIITFPWEKEDNHKQIKQDNKEQEFNKCIEFWDKLDSKIDGTTNS